MGRKTREIIPSYVCAESQMSVGSAPVFKPLMSKASVLRSKMNASVLRLKRNASVLRLRRNDADAKRTMIAPIIWTR